MAVEVSAIPTAFATSDFSIWGQLGRGLWESTDAYSVMVTNRNKGQLFAEGGLSSRMWSVEGITYAGQELQWNI